MREQTLLDQFVKEYFRFEGWDDVTIIADFPTGLSPQELREAHRALKGQALRQEVYALDGSDKQGVPYTVTASAYCLKLVQGQHKNRFASFYSYQQQSVSFSCERNASDPRILHDLTLSVDEYGNVLQKAQVVYSRKHIPTTGPEAVPTVVALEQAKMHIICTENTFTNDVNDISVNPNHYRLRMPATSKSFEVTGLTLMTDLWTVTALLSDIVSATEIDFLDAPVSGPEKRLLSHSRVRYLENDTSGPKAVGALESLGLEYQKYQLAFTAGFLNTATGDPYNDNVNAAKLSEGGYIDMDSDGNYWLPSGTAAYTSPTTNFYTPEVFTDPWGNDIIVSFWGSYWLLPESIEDAVGNTTVVTGYDWRILQPVSMTDINDNVTEIAFDILGLPAAMAVKGKGTEADNLTGLDTEDTSTQEDFWDDPEANAADLLGNATWRCIYDLSVQPTAVAMIARERHYADLATSPMLIRITYTDGFGRVAMHKAQAADDPVTSDPRWIGSGKTVYNNKGKPVLQYEPYFSDTHEYDPAVQAASSGVSARLYYDPLSRMRRTEMPDGTFSYTTWDTWKQAVYDANDTVTDSDWYTLRTTGALAAVSEEDDAADKAAAHYDTPTIMHLDTLMRPFYTIQDDGINSPIASHEVLDVLGNRLAVIDGRGNTALSYGYNLVKAVISQLSIDSGQTYMLLDVAGQPLYHWDAADREFHSVYDALRRPLEQWGDGKILSKITYGEGLASDKAKNLRGQVASSYDGAGKQYVEEYDFKGQPKMSYLKLLDDPTVADADWDSLDDTDLVSGEIFFTEGITDALGRPMSADSGRILGTGTPTIEHNITYNTYGKNGALKTVIVSTDTYVQDIYHNAKGQREAIWYGNGTKTSYTYDAENYRLRRLLTVRLSDNKKLQDLNYYYDPVGNITIIRDDAQEDVFFSGTIITPQNNYTYDALYRLIEAAGRESITAATFGTTDNISDTPHAFVSNTVPWNGSNTALQHYVQSYQYDAVGNILELQHNATSAGDYTRTYGYSTGSNRLVTTQIGSSTPYTYGHDSRGNMISMPHLSDIDYDLLNQMNHVTAGTVEGHYQYSGGQRVRKFLDKGSSVTEERIYFGNYEVYRKWTGTTLDVERTTIHVADDAGRIAMLEVLTQGDDSSADSLAKYIYSNHLQSTALELDDTGAIISYEEYHPYGTTAYQAKNSSINAVAKRYRFTGKERDEETGLNYHGARYYALWLGRWCGVDILESKYSPWSTYNYSFDNPVKLIDINGMGPTEPYYGGQLPAVRVTAKKLEHQTNIETINQEKASYTALNDAQLLVPKGFQVLTDQVVRENGGKGLPYVIALKSPEGEVFKWNTEAQWYKSDTGNEFNNPFYADIFNWTRSSTQHGIGQLAQDALYTGDPFTTIKASYSQYKDQGGNWGVAGFVGSGIKQSISQTFEDIAAGGNRRSNALIGIWQFGKNLGNPGFMEGTPLSVLTNKQGFLVGSITVRLPFDLKVGFYASEKSMASRTFMYSTLAPQKWFSSEYFGRHMLQITTEFQKQLGQMQRATIPKGTPVKIGLVGAQPSQGLGIPWLQITNVKPVGF
jgi:RHS repeat-associated protein